MKYFFSQFAVEPQAHRLELSLSQTVDDSDQITTVPEHHKH